MEAQQVIELAIKHADQAVMKSSAELCIEDAKACLARGLPEFAKVRALKSLAYSVGISSNVYKQAGE